MQMAGGEGSGAASAGAGAWAGGDMGEEGLQEEEVEAQEEEGAAGSWGGQLAMPRL